MSYSILKRPLEVRNNLLVPEKKISIGVVHQKEPKLAQ